MLEYTVVSAGVNHWLFAVSAGAPPGVPGIPILQKPLFLIKLMIKLVTGSLHRHLQPPKPRAAPFCEVERERERER